MHGNGDLNLEKWMCKGEGTQKRECLKENPEMTTFSLIRMPSTDLHFANNLGNRRWRALSFSVILYSLTAPSPLEFQLGL